MRLAVLSLILVFAMQLTRAGAVRDTTAHEQSFNFHFQTTFIYQYHPGFRALYSGQNSLSDNAENALSASSTFYIGKSLWNGASVYFNPEINGGNGFSQTRGIAGFPNGEIFRVDNPSPKIYIARLYFQQIIPLSGEMKQTDDDVNRLGGPRPESYISFYAGKFSIIDFFDNNSYAHDPRTQFLNWALMGDAAWDYPANTRGYTFGAAAELVKPSWSLRIAEVMVPTHANGSRMDEDISEARSQAVEFEHAFGSAFRQGRIRLIGFYSLAGMGSYREALDWGIKHSVAPSVDSVGRAGSLKFGFGVNVEQQLCNNAGFFFHASWNDGKTETWAFTEVDRSVNAGFVFSGRAWGRKDDSFGVAAIVNGLSPSHRDYLRAGGYGFIIGDGNLNYSTEKISEFYYTVKLFSFPVLVSPDYQFVIDPAYNRDRGPVHVFSIRAHLEI